MRLDLGKVLFLILLLTLSTMVAMAGTIIKGDKQTKAALIVEPGGYVEMRGTKNEPIVMTSEEAPGNRRPGDWGGLIICGKAAYRCLQGQQRQLAGGLDQL